MGGVRALLVLKHYQAASQYYRDAADCYKRSSVVCQSVCLSVCHSREPCKKAEPIEMPFGLWTRLGPESQLLSNSAHKPKFL